MKKIILGLFSALIISSAANSADISYGLSASITTINASGTETENTEKTNASVSNDTVIGSIFVENNFGSFSVGLDYIPFSADVSSREKTRTDTETSVGGTATTTSTSRTQKAQAEISNHITLYAVKPVGEKLFLKAGIVQVDVKSKESLGTGSSYGDETVNGGLIGIGVQGDKVRFSLEYTNYESISLTSKTNSDNKVSADIDTTQLKLSYLF